MLAAAPSARAAGAAAAPAAAAKSAAVAKAPESLEVMTFNMEHHNEPDELRVIAEHLKTDLKKVPDFILCQEVVFERHATEAAPEDNTAAVLARHLGYYCQGTKRTSDHEGIAIISKYPFEHYDSINLKNQTLRVLLGFRRVSVMGEFNVPGVGRVRVADTHLTNWGFEGHVRRGQIAETLQWVADREKAAPAVYTFFGGDFNAKMNWGEMQQITDPAEATLDYTSHNGTEYSQGSHGNPNKRIDFIFLAAANKPLASALTFAGEKLLWPHGLVENDWHFYPSDHLAVVHTYLVNAAAIAAARNNGAIRTADVRD
jgi:endonuclease/exonuclease/phosphatase family metal-dependent hydrolase